MEDADAFANGASAGDHPRAYQHAIANTHSHDRNASSPNTNQASAHEHAPANIHSHAHARAHADTDAYPVCDASTVRLCNALGA